MSTSIDTPTPGSSAKSKRPTDSAFKQQRLPAWQPVLTASTVLPTFFVIGILFIPVGVGLLYFSDEVREHSIDYTHCISTDAPGTNLTCAEVISKNPDQPCNCSIDFSLNKNFTGNVFMYYGLSNYYQNHRRYVKSRDDNQLLGHIESPPSSDCAPFAFSDGANPKPIAPCGAIANSLFSDVLKVHSQEYNKELPLLRTEIAWPSDRDIKFRNPPGSDLKQAFSGFAKPNAWRKNIWELDEENPNNNGFQNEDLIVWMRTAALPTFRKLYRRIDHGESEFSNGLPKGNYTLHVQYWYSVSAFEGSKKMILSTTSLLGGKNPFLGEACCTLEANKKLYGIAYIVVGCVCLVLGIGLLVIHIKCSKSSSEMINVNPRTPCT